MTTTCLSPFDEFMLHFEALKDAAKGHQSNDLKLGRIISLASLRYEFVDKCWLRLTDNANDILHNYGNLVRMSEQDEPTILEFMKTLKIVVQRGPE
jgi:hypothetical protein